MDLFVNNNEPQTYKLLSKISKIFLTRRSVLPVEATQMREEQEIINSIKTARNEWINAHVSFDYVDDKDMIDYFTYKIKACQVRYEYFIKKAKEMGIKVESLETAGIAYMNDNN